MSDESKPTCPAEINMVEWNLNNVTMESYIDIDDCYSSALLITNKLFLGAEIDTRKNPHNKVDVSALISAYIDYCKSEVEVEHYNKLVNLRLELIKLTKETDSALSIFDGSGVNNYG